jgi:hypothetical protein
VLNGADAVVGKPLRRVCDSLVQLYFMTEPYLYEAGMLYEAELKS